MSRVYLAYTGGTIGMARTADGYAPVPGFLAKQLAAMPELHAPPMPEIAVHEYDVLLDSANMTPANWRQIALDIAEHYDEYDGFVVLHGTDTMAVGTAVHAGRPGQAGRRDRLANSAVRAAL
jgi:L-asparaginase